jgi:hypothetical protein
MNRHLSIERQASLSMTLMAIAVVCAVSAEAMAEQAFKRGDKVMASPSMLKDDKYYKPCTVLSWDGNADAYMLDCGGSEYAVPPAYVRAASGSTPASGKDSSAASDHGAATVEKPRSAGVGASVTPVSRGGFNVGDRVKASVGGLKDDKFFQPCTVISALKNDAYGLRCDPWNGQPAMEYSVRPDWIRAWPKATPAPAAASCPFNKDYGKVSHSVPASAKLFKSVIFEWQHSTSDFYDFGLTFIDFQVGSSFRNAALDRGRKTVDTAPVGATVYPVKTKELICERSSTLTKRRVREIEYDCYKSEAGEWVCKNGLPKYLEQTSIPNN